MLIDHSMLPDFVVFDKNSYTISPSVTQAPGLYQVQGTLSDGVLVTAFSFNIAVLKALSMPATSTVAPNNT